MRNYALDFFKGLLAIHVIMIHTVFHSGNSYVPQTISGWVLCLDIPIFVLISGILYSYHESPQKKIKEIFDILKKWGIFVAFCFIYLKIVDSNSVFFKDILSWIVFNPQTDSIYTISVQASLDFMVYYIQSNVACSIIIFFTSYFSKSKEECKKNIFYILLLLFFILISIQYGVDYSGLSPLFIGYCIFFLIGYLSSHYHFKNFFQFMLIEFLTILILYVLFKFNGYTIASLQALKLDMNFLYVGISFISIFLVIYLKDKFSFTHKAFQPLCYLGKNSIYLYFAQGISSSLLFLIVPKIQLSNLYLKIILMFLINFGIAIFVFFLLKLIYWLFSIFQKKIVLLH